MICPSAALSEHATARSALSTALRRLAIRAPISTSPSSLASATIRFAACKLSPCTSRYLHARVHENIREMQQFTCNRLDSPVQQLRIALREVLLDETGAVGQQVALVVSD